MQKLFDNLNKYMIPDLSAICFHYFTRFSKSRKPIDELAIYALYDNYVGVEEIINKSDKYFKQHLIDFYCKTCNLNGLKIVDQFIKDDEINWKWPYMVVCHDIKGRSLDIIKYLIEYKKEHLDVDYVNIGYSYLCGDTGYFHPMINETRQYFIDQGATICYQCCDQCPDGMISVKDCLCCEQLRNKK